MVDFIASFVSWVERSRIGVVVIGSLSVTGMKLLVIAGTSSVSKGKSDSVFSSEDTVAVGALVALTSFGLSLMVLDGTTSSDRRKSINGFNTDGKVIVVESLLSMNMVGFLLGVVGSIQMDWTGTLESSNLMLGWSSCLGCGGTSFMLTSVTSSVPDVFSVVDNKFDMLFSVISDLSSCIGAGVSCTGTSSFSKVLPPDW